MSFTSLIIAESFDTFYSVFLLIVDDNRFGWQDVLARQVVLLWCCES
jgi:hypothetical protein